MVPRGKEGHVYEPCGTLIFTGATGGLRGKPPWIAFAQAKAGGERAVAGRRPWRAARWVRRSSRRLC